MIEEAGALDVYFEEAIEIVVADPESFDPSAVGEVLANKEIEFTQIKAQGTL